MYPYNWVLSYIWQRGKKLKALCPLFGCNPNLFEAEITFEVKPHVITAVPRLLEKVFDKFYEKGDELKGLKKNLFYWAIKIGLNYTPFKSQSFLYQIKLKIAYKLILSKWKDALGGNLVHIQSGSAALQPL